MAVLLINGANLNAQRAVNAADASAAQDLTTLSQVNALIAATVSGKTFKDPVRAASTAALPASTATVQTLTATANGALPLIDGISLLVGERVLIKNEGAPGANGIYDVTDLGSAGTPWILTRSADSNTAAEVVDGTTTRSQEGTANADKQFTQTTDGVIVLGTTALVYIDSSGITYSAGNGLALTGTVFSVALDGGANSGLAVAAGGLKVLLGATPGLTLTGGLAVLLDTAPGLVLGAGGLKVDYSTITRKTAANSAAAATTTVTHNYGTRDLQVAVFDTVTNEFVYPDISMPNTNDVLVTFSAAVGAGAYRIVIQG